MSWGEHHQEGDEIPELWEEDASQEGWETDDEGQLQQQLQAEQMWMEGFEPEPGLDEWFYDYGDFGYEGEYGYDDYDDYDDGYDDSWSSDDEDWDSEDEFLIAIREDDRHLFTELLENPDVNLSRPVYGDSNGLTAFHYAAGENAVHFVKEFLRSERIDVNLQVEPRQNTSIHEAVYYNASAVVKEMVLNDRVNLSILNGEGKTPAALAATEGSLDSLNWLLVSGREVGEFPPETLGAYRLEVQTLLEAFREDPAQTREKLQLELGIYGFEVAEALLNANFGTLPRRDEHPDILSIQSLNLADRLQDATLSENIGQFKNIRSLHLQRNNLTALPSTITELTQLAKLDLSENELHSLAEIAPLLTAVSELSLSHCHLNHLPSTFEPLKNLTTLDLSRNHLLSVPTAIAELVNLTDLNLSENSLSFLPDSFSNMRSLIALDISSNLFADGDDEGDFAPVSEVIEKLLFENPRLKKLDISHSGLEHWECLVRSLLWNFDHNFPQIKISYPSMDDDDEGLLLPLGGELARLPLYLTYTFGFKCVFYCQALFSEREYRRLVAEGSDKELEEFLKENSVREHLHLIAAAKDDVELLRKTWEEDDFGDMGLLLHVAASQGSVKVIEELREHLKSTEVMEYLDQNEDSPLHTACRAGQDRVVGSILKGSYNNFTSAPRNSTHYFVPNLDDETPFMLACANGNLDSIEHFLELPTRHVLSFFEPHLPTAKWYLYVLKPVAEMHNYSPCGIPEVDDLIAEFVKNPDQVLRDLGTELGISERRAAEYFGLVVYHTDGYLQLRGNETEDTSRFFKIAHSLPMEIQMKLCNICWDRSQLFISTARTEGALRKFARKFKEQEVVNVKDLVD